MIVAEILSFKWNLTWNSFVPVKLLSDVVPWLFRERREVSFMFHLPSNFLWLFPKRVPLFSILSGRYFSHFLLNPFFKILSTRIDALPIDFFWQLSNREGSLDEWLHQQFPWVSFPRIKQVISQVSGVSILFNGMLSRERPHIWHID